MRTIHHNGANDNKPYTPPSSGLFGGKNRMPWHLANQIKQLISHIEEDDDGKETKIELEYDKLETAFQALVLKALEYLNFDLGNTPDPLPWAKIYNDVILQKHALEVAHSYYHAVFLDEPESYKPMLIVSGENLATELKLTAKPPENETGNVSEDGRVSPETTLTPSS